MAKQLHRYTQTEFIKSNPKSQISSIEFHRVSRDDDHWIKKVNNSEHPHINIP